MPARDTEIKVESVAVNAFTVPTDLPESDGTFQWDRTTIVVVQVLAGGRTGVGYTYAAKAAGALIRDMLAPVVNGLNPMDIPTCWRTMTEKVRNDGDAGLCCMAISAVDAALWDLKAKLLDLPLVRLLGAVRRDIPAYGSGGFTSYSVEQLQEQLGSWASEGFSMVKMKIGRQPAEDAHRILAARQAMGGYPALFVDANGGYDRKQALALAARFPEWGVSWYEEPVSHTDFQGLRMLKSRVPAEVEVTIGEYGFNSEYFSQVIQAEAVDVLQADATRCGITGFLRAGALCHAAHLPMSSHCAPSLHLHVCCAVQSVRHMEYFHDHVRIEHLLFDGAATADQGTLRPDLSRPGLGLEFKPQDAHPYEIPL
jgi:L-alanine-DL-glutamate epimerase-like enolase superfamily enzyme